HPRRPSPFPYTTLFRSDGTREIVGVIRETALENRHAGQAPAVRQTAEQPAGSELGEFVVIMDGRDMRAVESGRAVGRPWLERIRSEEHTSELQSRFDLV